MGAHGDWRPNSLNGAGAIAARSGGGEEVAARLGRAPPRRRRRYAPPVQLRGGDAAAQQRVDEEPRRAGLEPVRLELALPEEKQAARRDGVPTSPNVRGRPALRTAARCPRTAPSGCPRTGSCRNVADGRGSSGCLRPPDGRRRPSCRRSSSPPHGSYGRSGYRWTACVRSWGAPYPPLRERSKPNPAKKAPAILVGAFVQPGHAPMGGGERRVRAPGRPLRGDHLPRAVPPGPPARVGAGSCGAGPGPPLHFEPGAAIAPRALPIPRRRSCAEGRRSSRSGAPPMGPRRPGDRGGARGAAGRAGNPAEPPSMAYSLRMPILRRS